MTKHHVISQRCSNAPPPWKGVTTKRPVLPMRRNALLLTQRTDHHCSAPSDSDIIRPQPTVFVRSHAGRRSTPPSLVRPSRTQKNSAPVNGASPTLPSQTCRLRKQVRLRSRILLLSQFLALRLLSELHGSQLEPTSANPAEAEGVANSFPWLTP